MDSIASFSLVLCIFCMMLSDIKNEWMLDCLVCSSGSTFTVWHGLPLLQIFSWNRCAAGHFSRGGKGLQLVSFCCVETDFMSQLICCFHENSLMRRPADAEIFLPCKYVLVWTLSKWIEEPVFSISEFYIYHAKLNFSKSDSQILIKCACNLSKNHFKT